MKITTKSALLITGALLAMQVAQASAAETPPGWYGGLGAGVNFENNSKSSAPAGTTTFKFDPGYDVEGNVGYAWDSGFRLEGEAFHGNSVVTSGKDGDLKNTDLFANVLYDINICPYITPYIGAGFGAGFPGADNIGRTSSGGHLSDTRIQLAYQGIAGFAVPIDNHWSVTTDYRYIATLDPSFADSAGSHDRTGNSSHNLLVGVRYSFNAPAPVAAPRTVEAPHVQPKAMAKPAVAPVPQTFQVFFDFDKADLTPEAQRIIASAAEEYKSGKYVRIVVTGHTDTKGTAKYNKKLSDRRAAAVKAEFAKLGVDANVITAKGVGKNGLLVPTNDQVREAQNRRAEIVLDKK
jgi:OmpA-OmpF porin, OOP family